MAGSLAATSTDCFKAMHSGVTFLARLGAAAEQGLCFNEKIEKTLDQLADHLETHLDADRILEIARSR